MNIKVKKRNGSLEEVDYNKIHKVLYWATEGIKNVCVSDIEVNAELHLYDGITTEEIHKVLIQSASELISKEYPNYQIVAGRLLMHLLRKGVYNTVKKVPHIKKIISKNIEAGVYDPILLDLYDDEELDTINDIINHERDFDLTYAGAKQLLDKYLIQDRSSNTYYETPQFAFMLIGMVLFQNYQGNERLQYVRKFYNAVSKFKINLPTPVMCGVRTPNRQYSSCTLIDVGDDMESLIHSNAAVTKYTSKRAGIGLNAGRIRAVGSKIRGGEVVSTGVIPFLKWFTAATRCCTQNGVRGGNATTHYPFWHLEVEDLLVLKNNKGSEDNRVRTMDYSIQLNKTFYKRVQNKGEITLFSPHEVPDLYDAFAGDSDKFEELYIKYEENPNIKKRKIGAIELFKNICAERIETGRIYIMNIDHCNTHGSFLDPIFMSNLCVSPETKVLTKKGYIEINSLEDEHVDVWNGEEWSNVLVKRTSDHQELIKVHTSNGNIECTNYHKFYIVDGSNYSRDKKMIMKRAIDLKNGDKIIKCDFPVIEGSKTLKNAYTIGMHTGDGTYNKGKPYITLYDHKQSVLNKLNAVNIKPQKDGKRIVCSLNIPNNTKYKIPSVEYSIKSRLEWLGGYIDADGHLTKNGIQIKSSNKEFILELKFMLQTLGVNPNLTYNVTEDGIEEIKGQICNVKASHRICINGFDSQKLYNLGLKEHIHNKDILPISLQRDSRQFTTIERIEKTGRYDKTFCFTEEKRGMGIFNGIITGNCQEITLPTFPIQHIDDGEDTSSEIALCVLAALNFGTIKFNEIPSLCNLVVRALDFIIDHQDYPIKAAEKMKDRRSIGVGIINLAYFFAKRKLSYEDPEALNILHEFVESYQYHLLKASNELAKEKGTCKMFDRTKYSKGILPIDTYSKNLDNICSTKLLFDWEELRDSIKNYGLANSTVSAIMPSESSAIVSGATNGIEPPRDLISFKKSKKSVLPCVVPEISKYEKYYTTAFEMESNIGYLNVCGVIQKFIDQAISVNNYYSPDKYEDGNLPLSIVMKDLFHHYSIGGKTLYYANTNDGREEEKDLENQELESNAPDNNFEGCEGGACSI